MNDVQARNSLPLIRTVMSHLVLRHLKVNVLGVQYGEGMKMKAELILPLVDRAIGISFMLWCKQWLSHLWMIKSWKRMEGAHDPRPSTCLSFSCEHS